MDTPDEVMEQFRQKYRNAKAEDRVVMAAAADAQIQRMQTMQTQVEAAAKSLGSIINDFNAVAAQTAAFAELVNAIPADPTPEDFHERVHGLTEEAARLTALLDRTGDKFREFAQIFSA